MMGYVGSVFVGDDLVQVWAGGKVARYLYVSPDGAFKAFDERIRGELPIQLGALKLLLNAVPPGMTCQAAHGSHQFFKDWENTTLACTLEQD